MHDADTCRHFDCSPVTVPQPLPAHTDPESWAIRWITDAYYAVENTLPNPGAKRHVLFCVINHLRQRGQDFEPSRAPEPVHAVWE